MDRAWVAVFKSLPYTARPNARIKSRRHAGIVPANRRAHQADQAFSTSEQGTNKPPGSGSQASCRSLEDRRSTVYSNDGDMAGADDLAGRQLRRAWRRASYTNRADRHLYLVDIAALEARDGLGFVLSGSHAAQRRLIVAPRRLLDGKADGASACDAHTLQDQRLVRATNGCHHRQQPGHGQDRRRRTRGCPWLRARATGFRMVGHPGVAGHQRCRLVLANGLEVSVAYIPLAIDPERHLRSCDAAGPVIAGGGGLTPCAPSVHQPGQPRAARDAASVACWPTLEWRGSQPGLCNQ